MGREHTIVHASVDEYSFVALWYESEHRLTIATTECDANGAVTDANIRSYTVDNPRDAIVIASDNFYAFVNV